MRRLLTRDAPVIDAEWSEVRPAQRRRSRNAKSIWRRAWRVLTDGETWDAIYTATAIVFLVACLLLVLPF